ncbi:hypothetical protein [Exiguobacterium sp. R-39]|uniref:hypothetical protein n=1 Tax=Exiguobacterium sp. R-39 TaxID=3416708 RepID=UPI003CFB052F
MIETVLSEFRKLSKEYSKTHFRPTQRTLSFKVYFFSMLSFFVLLLITSWALSHSYSFNTVVRYFVVTVVLLGIALISERFSNKHLVAYRLKKNHHVKLLLKEYLRNDHRIVQAEQMKHLSTMISKTIQIQRKHYKFNPSYFSIVLAVIFGFLKFWGDGTLTAALSLCIFCVFIFAITHFFLTARTNYLNFKVETCEEMLGVIDEITLEMLIDHQNEKSVAAKKKRFRL